MRSLFSNYLIIAPLVLALAGCSTVTPTPTPTPTPNVPAATKSVIAAKEGYHVPKTNCEIRDWYNYQVVAIPVVNKRWTEVGLGAAERARRAFKVRHNARINARFMMPDQSEVKDLQERDQKKYGNPDGPTLPYLVKKLRTKGLKGDPLYNSIIASSSRTSAKYNAECVKPS